MKELHIRIEGRVQGVGFRRWVVKKAQGIGGVSGWVRNEYDGSVEVLMKGDDDSINLMLQACYEGPVWARVDRISFLLQQNDVPEIVDGRFIII